LDATEGVNTPGLASRNEVLMRVGLIERHFFNTPHIQATLVETIEDSTASYAVLVFRGTRGHLSNWLLNFKLAMSKWPTGGRVHQGFKTIFMEIWNTIDAVLSELTKPLFYTGHSLGGAMATLAGSLRPPRAVYTFGSPRIGDTEFTKTLTSLSVYNICNPHDIVTELPPANRWIPFTHAGTIVKNTEVHPPYRTLSEAPSFLADHAPINYTVQVRL
jgi:hypothetical protein